MRTDAYPSNAFILSLPMQICYHAPMNFRQLRAFAMIVDAGGFARAAARLHVSQPALSRQVLNLENELGIPLFDREPRQVRLTSQGEEMLRHCRKVLSEVEALAERARAVKKGQSGVLRVGATPQVIETLLSDFILTFRRRHPQVEVHLSEQGGARLPTSLERGDVHLAIMPTGDDRFRGPLLYPMYILAVTPSDHRLGKRKVLEVSELDDAPVLKLDASFASHQWFEAACNLSNTNPRIILESASPQTIVSLARSGHGIAIVPSPIRIVAKGIRTVPIVHNGDPIGRWAVAAWNPRRYLPTFAQNFVNELLPHVERSFPGHELVRAAPKLPNPIGAALKPAR